MPSLTIDSKQILEDTNKGFMGNSIQKAKFDSLAESVGKIPEHLYKELYNKPLVRTTIKIDVDQFEREIPRYDNWFAQWGHTFAHLPRKAVALTNIDGVLKDNDPVNKSLYEYNIDNPTAPLLDCDFTKPTEILDLPSLQPLRELDPYWCRSNILRWDKGAHFYPHIDCTVDGVYWLRLWGTTSNNCRLRFQGNDPNVIEEHDDIEPGRIYLIDTSLIHDARCIEGRTYQFFLATLPQSFFLLQDIKC